MELDNFENTDDVSDSAFVEAARGLAEAGESLARVTDYKMATFTELVEAVLNLHTALTAFRQASGDVA